jgi:hypothetical protein
VPGKTLALRGLPGFAALALPIASVAVLLTGCGDRITRHDEYLIAETVARLAGHPETRTLEGVERSTRAADGGVDQNERGPCRSLDKPPERLSKAQRGFITT